MAQIIRRTEATFFGPWLLDKAALAAFDDILDEQWKQLENYRRQQIVAAIRRTGRRSDKSSTPADPSDNDTTAEDKEIARRVAKDYRDDGCTITLTLSTGNKIRLNRFREAESDVACQDREVTKIELKVRCGGITCDLVVPIPDKNHGLSLVALPEASSQADEMFVKLNRWSEQYKPDWLHRLRGSPPGTGFLVYVSVILLMLASGIICGVFSVKSTWRDEIRKLVANGVKPEDHGRALELLLRQSAYLPNDETLIVTPTWFQATFLTVTAVMGILVIILAVPASTAFEIGKGAASVQRQKWYDNLLRNTLPAFLIMGVFAGKVAAFVHDLYWSK